MGLLSDEISRTSPIEVGMQNSTLGAVLSIVHLAADPTDRCSTVRDLSMEACHAWQLARWPSGGPNRYAVFQCSLYLHRC
jgi:hypothetical protein